MPSGVYRREQATLDKLHTRFPKPDKRLKLHQRKFIVQLYAAEFTNEEVVERFSEEFDKKVEIKTAKWYNMSYEFNRKRSPSLAEYFDQCKLDQLKKACEDQVYADKRSRLLDLDFHLEKLSAEIAKSSWSSPAKLRTYAELLHLYESMTGESHSTSESKFTVTGIRFD